MNTMTKKSLLLGVSALAVVMSVATSSNVAQAAWGNITVDTNAAQTSTGNNENLNITGAGKVHKNAITAIADATHVGLKITINTTSAADGIISTGGNMAVDGATNANSHIDNITVTQGTISTNQAAKATISLAGAAGSTAFTVGTTGTITNTDATAAAGRAIAVSDANGAQVLTIDNAGTISSASTGATAMAIDLTAMNTAAGSSSTITNSGTISVGAAGYAIKGANQKVTITNSGTITGLVDLGAQASSGMTINTGSNITGDITFNSATQTLTYNGGTLTGKLIGAGNNKGAVTLNADLTTTDTWGAGATLASVTVAAGKKLSVAHNVSTAGKLNLGVGSTVEFTAAGKTLVANVEGGIVKATAAGASTITGTVGATTAVESIIVGAGATLGTSSTVKATAITIANTGIFNPGGTVEGAVTLSGATSTMTLVNKLTGNVEGAGIVNINTNTVGSFATGGTFGATTALASMKVTGGANDFTVNHAISATQISIDNNNNVILAAGGKLTGKIDGVAAGQGVLKVQTTAATNGVIGGSFGLASIAVSGAGTNYTLNHNTKSTAITAATDSTLTIGTAGLTVEGTIDGAAGNQGTLDINANFKSTTKIGNAARLASINVNSGATFTPGPTATANFDANTVTVKNGGSLKVVDRKSVV